MKKYIFLFLVFLLSCSEIQSQNSHLVLPESRIAELKNFIRGKKYSQEIAVFINFKTPSGKYRYFVYDLKNNKILQKAIVSHGSGSVKPKSDELIFSNTENSYQSSLGKYEIAESYSGKFGKSYRLRGLDSTNSNAYARAIVLHSFDCVNDKESENPACLSLGCPMLSPKAFKETVKFLDQSKNPVIMYAFY